MKNIVLQIKVKKGEKEKLTIVSKEHGFKSLSIFLEFIIEKIINKEISIPEISKTEIISEEYSKYLEKRLKETEKSIEEGNYYSVLTAEEFMKVMDEEDSI